jgi:hypothetical protein
MSCYDNSDYRDSVLVKGINISYETYKKWEFKSRCWDKLLENAQKSHNIEVIKWMSEIEADIMK